MRVNAEIGAQRYFDAVEHEGLLPDQRRRARRRRRQNGVDLGKQLQQLALIPAAEFLRLDDQRGRQHGARDQPVAHRRVEILRTGAQPLEVQASGLARGDDVGGGTGALGLRNDDFAIGAQRRGHAIDGVDRFRGLALEVAAGDGDAQAIGPASQKRSDRLGGTIGADRIVGIVALHRVVSEREVVRAARQRADMIEACREGERARAAQPPVSRLEPEHAAERSRGADRAIGVGAERKRHETAGDRGGRAARGAAGHACAIMRVVHRTVMEILAGEIIGVFAHVQRADEDGAGGFEPLDQCRVAPRRRCVAIDLRAGKRRHPGNVEEILHRERHAGEDR